MGNCCPFHAAYAKRCEACQKADEEWRAAREKVRAKDNDKILAGFRSCFCYMTGGGQRVVRTTRGLS
jgi:predicted ATPase